MQTRSFSEPRSAALAGCSVLLTAFALSACSHQAGGAGAEQPNKDGSAEAEGRAVLGRTFRFRFAIYTKERLPVDIGGELEGSGFLITSESVRDAPPPSRPRIFFAQPPIEEFALPDADSLEYFAQGMTPEEMRQLLECRAVTVFEVSGAASPDYEGYKRALGVADQLAKKVDGYVWDDETRNVYTSRGWRERAHAWQAALPTVSRHVAIHAYRDGELIRLVSLGMVKFGLPDVAVEGVSGRNTNAMGNLMNLILQHLAEGRRIDRRGTLHVAMDDVRNAEAKAEATDDLLPNATRRLDVRLTLTLPKEGDADNRLLALRFSEDPKTVQERHEEALGALFGSTDAIEYIDHDTELLAASERARNKAFALRTRFAAGPSVGEHLLVKVPFKTLSGGNEWMWVEVVTWRGDVIDGILANDPFEVPSLRAGSRVQVNASDIFDYILKNPDGSEEGNETAKILEARSKRH